MLILGHPALWQENSDSRHFWSSCVRAGVTVQVVGLNVVHEIKGEKKLVISLWKSSASADINLSTLALLFLHQPHTASTPVLPPCQTAALTTPTSLIITATNKSATTHDGNILHLTLLPLVVVFQGKPRKVGVRGGGFLPGCLLHLNHLCHIYW